MVAYLVTQGLSGQQSGIGKELELTVQRSGRYTGQTGYLPNMEILVGTQQQKGQYAPPVIAEKGFGKTCRFVLFFM
jgi:hypothetical protein